MSTKADRRAAREAVSAYHEQQLGELVRHVKLALESFEAGELNAFEVDELIFQYSRAAKELWKFCILGSVEITARFITDAGPDDWWDRGARKER